MLDATPLNTPKIDGDRTRSAILRAAQALFVEHGFATTSMATVAKQAGVTKSLIHHHFGSKRELWDAVRDVVMEDYQRQQQEMLSQRAPDLSLVEDSFVVYFRFLQSNPDVMRLWNWMVIENDAQCASMSQALSCAGVDTLRRAQEQGSMRKDVEPEYVLAQFFALVRGWFSERAIMQASVLHDLPDNTCDERYLRATVKVFIDGLRPR
ncbi:MAG: TetR/AcrR family transcriptional regulator [Myxococcales bacterium]